MAIKKFFVTKPKDGYPYDRKTGQYFSWGYDIWINRERREERGFLTKDAAEKTVNQLKEKARNARNGLSPRSNKVPYLVDLFQAKLDTLSGAERSRAKRVFNDFLTMSPPRLKVTEIRKAHLKAYELKRTADGVSKATIRRETVPIIAALNAADEFFEALEDYRPPKMPRPKVPKMRKSKTIYLEERKAILGSLLKPRTHLERREFQYEARRRTGLFLQFCLLTVSRPGEIASLKKSAVDWSANVVSIIGTKTRYLIDNPVRYIRITPTMRVILQERFEKATGDFLFVKGGKVTARMREILKTACEDHGIEYGNGFEGITFNTARHTGATELARSNRVDTKTAGAFTGHSDQTMTLYYTHTNPQLVDIAGEVLEETMGMSLYDGEFSEVSNEQRLVKTAK